MQLILKAFYHHLVSLLSRPKQFFLVTLGSLLNNILYVFGIFIIAKASFGRQFPLHDAFFITTGLVITAIGITHLFLGGIYEMSHMIESGKLESHLAIPRNPILLAAISQSEMSGFAETLQGLAIIFYVGLHTSFHFLIKLFLASFITGISILAVIIFTSTLTFFLNRGSIISSFLSQVFISMSLFPTALILKGKELLLLFMTPLFITSYLPLKIVFQHSMIYFIYGFSAASIVFFLSLQFFKFGLNYFQSSNSIMLRN